ncbi:MAG: erythromycin esterase family protein [Vicinamibacteria bacterium]|nr:erythromycin esterase family protein [Vicinamibacteria bacterium]
MHWRPAAVVAGLALGLACGPRPDERDALALQLADVSFEVRSIDPADRDFRDLEPLSRSLTGVRVVLLGEPTHGDGSLFLAKTRLIEYLHQRHGFDVLALESGLHSCERAGDAILAGRPAREMIDAAVFDVWGRSAQFQPLVDYLEATRASARPLELTGFDAQLTGSLSTELPAEITRALGDRAAAHPAWFAALRRLLESASRWRKADAATRGEFAARSAAVAAELDARGGEEAAFLAQVVRSTERNAFFWGHADFEKPVPAVMNVRDAQMADNLLWLLAHRYSGRRVIVWAATSHAIRNRQAITPPFPDPGMVPMGHHLHERLGAEAYVLALVGGEGRVGTWRQGAWDLARPRRGSLERALGALGGDARLLDLRAPGAAERFAWPLSARPMGYVPMLAPWPRLVDGLLFVRRVEPSTERED